ncbi:MAG: GTPase Era [Pseudomonadota bacterium]
MQIADNFRCGYVAVVGRPNVGKSTLINAVMGRKVSIVTNKPQTTRHRILAVHNTDAAQIIFVDTPGIHRKAGKAMNRLMNRTAANALEDADVILFVCEAERWTDEDEDVLTRVRASQAPCILLLNKVDLVHPKPRLFDILTTMSERHRFAEIVPTSARRGTNLDALMKLLPDYLPESPPFFPEDMHTDRSVEFHAAEIVREKLTQSLQQELPYGLTVQIERLQATEEGTEVYAVIWVERDSQKGMVVGKGGHVLKQVGIAARHELREQLGGRVHLELWVKVKDNWADNEQDLLRLGYEAP